MMSQILFQWRSLQTSFHLRKTFAWINKFKALLIRFDRKDAYFMGAYFIAFV